MRGLLIGGVLFSVSAWLISWLLDVNSPYSVDEYSLWYSQMREWWARINIPSYIIGAIASGSPHGMNEPAMYAAFFIQWMLIGIIFTWVLRLFRRTKPQ